MHRRQVLKGLATLAGGASLAGCASLGGARPQVVVVGAGWGGSTVSKYIRLLSDQRVDVTLVEPNPAFVSCPISNLLLSGRRTLADITHGYDNLVARHGVKLLRGRVAAVDAGKRQLRLADGATLGYDKLVLAPGIDMMWDSVEGLQAAHAEGRILHAWKAGAETVALRRQLEAMRDGGTYAIVIPEAPYRCPPGPYERASVVAAYFKREKPRSKVLILDANPDVTSKGPLFKKAWAELYGGMVEYRGQHKAVAVDARSNTVRFEVQDDVRADVLNVLPTMRAGELVVQAGLANANARWCHVDFLNFESTAAKNVHVIGDAIQIAQGMPKSGHMANSHAKVAAAAIVAELTGLPVNPHPMLTNVCMSFVDDSHVIHVASVHEYVPTQKTFRTIGGSGGVSDVRSDLEAVYTQGWARNIWNDMLG
ncbi:MAG: FAD-dependent oxidoreductase [Burkholderiaceae bacterium]|nr:FAD-dependent oxidoreductase [Burkholderiaceae bacterium]